MKINLARRQTNRQMGRTGTILFFSVFLLMGSVFTWVFLFRPILKVLDARNWSKTPCTIVSSELQSHSGDDGTTYSVHIVYRYTVNGREHQSDRYEFMGGSSGGHDGKQKVVNRYPPGKQTDCYVNPSDPDDAVLQRDFTPMMLLGLIPLIFVAVGAGGIAWTIKSSSFIKPAEGVPPWQARPDWAAGRIVSSTKAAMWVTWVFALIWNAISWPVLFPFFNAAKKEPLMYLVFLFPLAGLFLISLAVRQTQLWRRFGESIFEMTSLPGAIGGALTGTIRLTQYVSADDGFMLRLRCVRLDNSGGSDSRSGSVLWEDERFISIGASDAVPVGFYIPPDCQETGDLGTAGRILWRLDTDASLGGAKYSAQFEVPVFKVAQTARQIAAAQQLRAAGQSAIASYQRPPNSPIRVEPSARGGTEFYFSAARNPGAAIGLTLFFLVWTGGIVGMIHLKAPVFMPILFGLFDLPVLLIMLSLWFGVSRVEVDRDAVTVTKTVLGWKRVCVVPVADIAEITTTTGMTSGTTVYRDLKLIRRAGKTVTLASSIKNHREAGWLAAEMAYRANVTPVSTP